MLNPEIVVNRRPIDRLARNSFLGGLAAGVQPVVARLLAAAGKPVADLLHGTVLGHPLHVVITDIPVGAWTVTAVLDAVELCGGSGAGSDAALLIGIAGAAGAALSGLADWSDTQDDPRTLGMAHALCNSVALGGYLTALALRRGSRRRLGLVVALGSYAVVGASAYLGGELSAGQMLGVKHTAEPLAPPPDFTPVLDVAALDAAPIGGRAVRADLNGIPLLISRVEGGGVAAISAVCTHRGGPLADGEVRDGCVSCPWHGSVFALTDGRLLSGPATFPQPRFDARINGEQIEVRALPV